MRFLLVLLCALAVFAQDSAHQLSSFTDPYGNVGSFWTVRLKGADLLVLKLRTPDQPGDANFAFQPGVLAEFEGKVEELKRTPNRLKGEGFEVLWTASYGDASLRTMLARVKNVPVKVIQVQEGDRKHQVAVDHCYPEFQAALKAAKKQKAP